MSQESDEKYVLRLMTGKYRGDEFPLVLNSAVVVGRSNDVDILLAEPLVSHQHARIVVGDDALEIEDMGSTNGTFVNGKRITNMSLSVGDRVLIGGSIMELDLHTNCDEKEMKRGDFGSEREKLSSVQEPDVTQRGSVAGRIEEVPLPGLLQLFSASRKSGLLVIRTELDVARVYLRGGRVYYASLSSEPELAPDEAFYRILAWQTGSFALLPASENIFEDELDISVERLLMEGMGRLDEIAELGNESTSQEDSSELSLALPPPPIPDQIVEEVQGNEPPVQALDGPLAQDSLGGQSDDPTVDRADAEKDDQSSLQSTCAGENLLKLLGYIDRVEELSCLSFFAEGQNEPIAEIVAQKGDVLLGARVQDVSLKQLLETGFFEEDEVDIAQLCYRWEAGPRKLGDETKKDQIISRVLRAKETRFYLYATAFALATVAEIAREKPLEIRYATQEGESSLLGFSAAALLLEAASLLCPPGDEFDLLKQQTLGDEHWILGQVPGSACYLPVAHDGSGASFEGLRRIIGVVEDLLGTAQRLDGKSLGISAIADQDIWGVVLKKQTVLLARGGQRGIGTMLSKMRMLT